MYPTVIGIVILCTAIGDVALISAGPSTNASAELLWRLSNLAVAQVRGDAAKRASSDLKLEQRQYVTRPQQTQHLQYPQQAQQIQYPQYAQNSLQYPHRYPRPDGPRPITYPTHLNPALIYATHGRPPVYPTQGYAPQGYAPQGYAPQGYAPQIQQTFMNALDSIAYNDELHCVPRLLCEMLSGDSRQASSILPAFINLDSLLTLLRSFDDANSSPLFKFGRAALLGYTSRGNSASCKYSYPKCPRDPDRLVEYLNNYNGGFFRFFNGVQQPSRQYPSPHANQAQKRIQTKPSANNERDAVFNAYDYREHKNQYGWRFPAHDVEINNYANGGYGYLNRDAYRRGQKSLQFPEGQDLETDNALGTRPSYGKEPKPVFFPGRTGTGDLRLDSDQLFRQPFQHYYVFN